MLVISTPGLCAEFAEFAHEHIEPYNIPNPSVRSARSLHDASAFFEFALVWAQGVFAPECDFQVVGFRVEKTADTEYCLRCAVEGRICMSKGSG